MKILYLILFLNYLNVCVSLDHVWHSYQHDPDYKSREETVITNITTSEFKLDYIVKKWKSLTVDKICYLAGLTENDVIIASAKINTNKTLELKSHKIQLKNKPIDVALFDFWNLDAFYTMVVVATEKPELLWYRMNETDFKLFWSWPMSKNISHINIFKIEYDYQLLIISEYLSHITADWYQFLPSDPPNFWLRQKIELSDFATSSAVITSGPNTFLSIPQKSLHTVQIYKLSNHHFELYKNISSQDVDDVISFKMGRKTFLAINGLEAGIYRLNKKKFIKEHIVDSHLEGVNYWLPITNGDFDCDLILIAQRVLKHGLHKSFVIEIITYNGHRFQEHEDIPCSYFGEELGLSCLPGEETGIQGSAAVNICLDDFIGVLVPRKNRFSEIYIFNNEKRKIPNPLNLQIKEFVNMKQRINDLISIQEERYTKMAPRGADFPAIHSQLDEIEDDVKNMTELIEEIQDFSHYETVIFNGEVEVKSSGIFDDLQTKDIDGESADRLLKDIVLRNNIGEIQSETSFSKLEVDNLIVTNINGIDSTEFLFDPKNFTISGELLLAKSMNVEKLKVGEVNGLEFENEIIDLASTLDELDFHNLEISNNAVVEKINRKFIPTTKFDLKNLEFDEFFVPGHIQVENVNGENFEGFLNELSLRNIRNYIPGTVKVNGDVTVLANVKTDFLNNLPFPEEYIFINKISPNITGFKNFRTITATDITCGTIDDISTPKIFTLTTDQELPGLTTFKNLKITESLNVDGNITGEQASKFLTNPTLQQTNFVKSKTHFKHLQIDGALIVDGNFNGENLESKLRDFVYSSEEFPVIEAMKQFPQGFTVSGSLLIASNSLNDVNLDDIVTKNTAQFLNISEIEGVINFGNVETGNLYNDIDIRKLDQELVKLNGEQYISSTLIFENEIFISKLEVVKNLKNLTQNFNNFDDNKNISAENIFIEGNLYGNFDNFDLDKFDKSRMSLTKDQYIEEDIVIEKSSIRNMLPFRVNDFDPEEFTQESNRQKLINKILNSELIVEDFYTKSAEIDKIDNETPSNLEGSFWKYLVKKNNLTNLIFNDDTTFTDLKIEKLSGVDFGKYHRNIIFKNETEVKVSNRKVFLKGFHVKKLIETQKLNHISLPNILSRHGFQEISGPLTIHGDVIFENNVKISENINDVPVKFLKENYQVVDGEFYISGDVLFNRLAHINNLKIQGYVDNRKVQEVVDGIIYKDDNFKISNLITFDNKVKIDKNIRVTGNINNIDFPAFVSDMILITKDADIKCDIKFVDEVFAEKIVTRNIKTQDLNGIDMISWIDNAIFITDGLLKGNYIFEDVRVVDNLLTEYINNININTLIPLRTRQELPELSFNEMSLFKDVSVGNSTNFRNLPEEFANSVTIDNDETIDSDITFQNNVIIEGDISLFGTLNNAETDRIVTTNTDQELNAVYDFRWKISLEENLTLGLVNGISLEKWAEDAVRISAQKPQNITDDWIIDQDLIFEDASQGHALINNVDFGEFSSEVEEKRAQKYEIEKGFIDDYTNICADLTFMYGKLKNQIYKFSHLEKFQILSFHRKIDYLYIYEYQNNIFLVVNEKQNCESHLYILDDHFRWIKHVHFGHISQIISVRSESFFYLVVQNHPFYSTCKVQGTNLWQLDDNNHEFVHQSNIEDHDLLQESLEPGTFYGMKGYVVTEFKVLPKLGVVKKHRKWVVREDNAAFVPRGLATGLALRTGYKLIKLRRDDRFSANSFSEESEDIIIGNITEDFNTYFPGRKGSDLAVMKVGIKSNKRNLLAVASHEETSVKGSLDFIKIYEDVITGKVFHKIPAYKPSSLMGLEFHNGETLLAFMEDENVLQIYEYKGIEGFKFKMSAKMQGSKIFTVNRKNRNKILGIVDKNRIHFMEIVMLGNQVGDDLTCSL